MQHNNIGSGYSGITGDKIPKKLHSVEERAGEDTETSSKKIPQLIFSFLFSTLCDLDQTLLADICAHCTFAMALATSNAKPGCVVALNQKRGRKEREGDTFVHVLLVVHCSFHLPIIPSSLPLHLLETSNPWHFGCGDNKGFFFIVIVSSIGGFFPPTYSQPAQWLYSTIALGFGFSQPRMHPNMGTLFWFCPSVAIALVLPMIQLQLLKCHWLFIACALHMIGNDALFTSHALTAELTVLGNCQTQKIECLKALWNQSQDINLSEFYASSRSCSNFIAVVVTLFFFSESKIPIEVGVELMPLIVRHDRLHYHNVDVNDQYTSRYRSVKCTKKCLRCFLMFGSSLARAILCAVNKCCMNLNKGLLVQCEC
ncbi:hypothetical protein Pelo_17705 [Pelomyxa schiedti]|nr:hypothetical protein Pelo_17705 [Pelomyxa schiedti]